MDVGYREMDVGYREMDVGKIELDVGQREMQRNKFVVFCKKKIILRIAY